MKPGVAISRYLSQPTLDDIMLAMLIQNLSEGKVWANYQEFKNFFEQLRRDRQVRLPKHVRAITDHTSELEIDRCMTRTSTSGFISYKAEIGNDYWYMNEDQLSEAKLRYERMSIRDKAAVNRLARRYGEHLRRIDR